MNLDQTVVNEKMNEVNNAVYNLYEYIEKCGYAYNEVRPHIWCCIVAETIEFIIAMASSHYLKDATVKAILDGE